MVWSNNEVLLTDHNGTRVFETLGLPITNVSSSSLLSNSQNQSLKSFSYLQSFQNVLNGQLGFTVELIDGVGAKIYYYPVHVYPHHYSCRTDQEVHYTASSHIQTMVSIPSFFGKPMMCSHTAISLGCSVSLLMLLLIPVPERFVSESLQLIVLF